MPRLAFVAAVALASALPAAARAQAPSSPPVGLSLSASLAGGGEFGLAEGKAGLTELELVAGWYSERQGLAAELAAVVGNEPDHSVALRPGVRWRVAGTPLRVRLALDASDARDSGFGFRWILAGAVLETRLTSLLALYAELDTGVPLRSGAGVPLLVRGGAAFRF
jgi:hypothetical protein